MMAISGGRTPSEAGTPVVGVGSVTVLGEPEAVVRVVVGVDSVVVSDSELSLLGAGDVLFVCDCVVSLFVAVVGCVVSGVVGDVPWDGVTDVVVGAGVSVAGVGVSGVVVVGGGGVVVVVDATVSSSSEVTVVKESSAGLIADPSKRIVAVPAVVFDGIETVYERCFRPPFIHTHWCSPALYVPPSGD